MALGWNHTHCACPQHRPVDSLTDSGCSLHAGKSGSWSVSQSKYMQASQAVGQCHRASTCRQVRQLVSVTEQVHAGKSGSWSVSQSNTCRQVRQLVSVTEQVHAGKSGSWSVSQSKYMQASQAVGQCHRASTCRQVRQLVSVTEQVHAGKLGS